MSFPRPPPPGGRLALALLAGMVALTAVRSRPPAPLPADAPAAAFSAARAREHLRAIAGDGRPRPVGSAAGAEARGEIARVLRAMGYQPEVQDAFACGAVRACGRVRNLWALKPGTSGPDGALVMLAAHYDSVPAGPGAGDDAAGVAVLLEIARALSLEPPARNPVLLLFTDGEEPGLIGAEAFVSEHPLAKRVAAVVNVEARGTSGPSLMFETGEGNGPLIDLFARHVARPLTNSLYHEVYRSLPNDSDLTVFKRAGAAGLNFGFIAGEAHYHTPRDDFAHLDPASLQHQGQNALGMARALASSDLGGIRGEDAVFFDVFAFATVRWPVRWMPWLGLLGLLLLGVGATLAVRRGHLTGSRLWWGLWAVPALTLSTAAVAAASYLLLRVGHAGPYQFLAFPVPGTVAFWVVPLAVALPVSSAFLRRAGRPALWLSGSMFLAALGAATAALRPGLAYPLVVPALAAGPLAIAWAFLARPAAVVPRWVWLPPFLVGTAVWLPPSWLLYSALGVAGLSGAAVALSVLLAPLSALWRPLDESRPVFRAAALLWAAALAAQVAAPRFTEDHPRKLNLEYQLLDAESGPTATWIATGGGGNLPEPLSAAVRFGASRTRTLPWPTPRTGHVAEAPVLPLQLPTFEVRRSVASDGKLRVTGRLASPRGAFLAGLALPGERLVSVKIGGKTPPGQRTKGRMASDRSAGGWLQLVTCTTGAEGVDYELELSGIGPIQGYAWDATAGLPEAGAHLIGARPSSAVPFRWGDVTMAIRPLRLEPR